MRTKDRRFIKTEAIIQKSMISLLNERNAEELQIEDLVLEADINKSTFYLHYQSLDLLVSALEDELLSGLTVKINELDTNHSRFAFFDTCLNFLKDNKKLAKAVLNASTFRFNQKVEDFGKGFLIPAPAKKRNRLVSNVEFLESSLIQSIVAYIRVWVFDSCRFENEKCISDLIELCGSNIYKDLLR